MIHVVKVIPKFFKPLAAGEKTFEVRTKDRPYEVGDYLAVNEFLPDEDDPYEYSPEAAAKFPRTAEGGGYSGECMLFRITYILDDPQYCAKGTVILGLSPVII